MLIQRPILHLQFCKESSMQIVKSNLSASKAVKFLFSVLLNFVAVIISFMLTKQSSAPYEILSDFGGAFGN